MRLGFFRNFNDGDALLLWGERQAFLELLEHLRQLASSKLRTLAVHQLGGVQSVGKTQLFMQTSDRQDEMMAEGVDQAMIVKLKCTAERYAEFADKIEALCSSAEPGHQYLDTHGSQPLEIIASMGEYPPEFGISK